MAPNWKLPRHLTLTLVWRLYKQGKINKGTTHHQQRLQAGASTFERIADLVNDGFTKM
jgi:hypothetical protein